MYFIVYLFSHETHVCKLLHESLGKYSTYLQISEQLRETDFRSLFKPGYKLRFSCTSCISTYHFRVLGAPSLTAADAHTARSEHWLAANGGARLAGHVELTIGPRLPRTGPGAVTAPFVTHGGRGAGLRRVDVHTNTRHSPGIACAFCASRPSKPAGREVDVDRCKFQKVCTCVGLIL